MVYIGIDPGKSGAWAVIIEDEKGRIDNVFVRPWDDVFFVTDMQALSRIGDGTVAAVEKVSARPGNGSVSMFHFGENFGYIQGVLSACCIPYQLVPPRKWKSSFSLDNDKKKSIEVCHKLLPELSLRKTERCRTDSDGLAEAALLALYAKRNL